MDLGALSKPSVVTARDGGEAALIGNSMFWSFGDTLMTVTGADGFNYRSSTGAWGPPWDRARSRVQIGAVLLDYSETDAWIPIELAIDRLAALLGDLAPLQSSEPRESVG
jgi:hypothetical protein